MSKKGSDQYPSIRWSIRSKLTIVITLLIISVVSILTCIQISDQKEIMEDELNKRILLMKENLIERGKGFVSNLTIHVEKDIAAFNFSGVIETVTSSVKKNMDVKYAVLISSSGLVFVHTSRPELRRSMLKDERTLSALNQNHMNVMTYMENGEPVIEISAPVQISTAPWGVIRVIYTLKYLNMEIDNSAVQILLKIQTMINKALLTSICFIFICFFIIFIFSKRFTTPIIQLTDSAKKLSKGDFSISSDIKVHSKDEVGILAAAFVEMSEDIRISYHKLEEYSKILEQKVFERTWELRKKNIKLIQMNDELEKTLNQLQESQAQLIQSEKMAALGHLIAGIAHEINNPLGVIRGSGNSIFKGLNDIIFKFPEFFHLFPEEIQRTLLVFLKQAMQNKQNLSTREARKIRRKLTEQLKAARIESAESLADTLVDIGIYEDITPFISLLKLNEASEILMTAYTIYGMNEDSRNIITAVERASKIVFALKKFTHHDPEGKKNLTDIADSIETVLTLYYSHIKQGVEVIRDYREVPLIMCYQDELNQVWTNLIHNALQAMNYKGTLEIQINEKNDNIFVSITDGGRGIPKEIQERIFEPFFTTKGLGEGSGLGLDISRKIIEKHEGSIKFESRPGRTKFIITLPVSG